MSTPLSTLIVDDEPLALDLMERYVLRTPFLRLEAKCSGGAEALEALAGGGIDVAFLDIQMPGMNGLELSRLAGDRTRVIFTTAFQQYALEGFRADAIDYLLKPIDYNEFLRAAHKALKWFSLTREKTEPAPSAPAHTYLLVRSDYRQVRIDTSDILYIEALKDYVKIFLASSAQPVITQSSLKSLEERLPAGQFMRIHRSYIVRLDAVKIIERSRVVFGKTYLPISDTCRDDFLRTLEGRSIPQ